MKKILWKKPGRIAEGRYLPLRRPAGLRLVDIHCHCLAGLDDGPRNMTESLMLCRVLVAEGITTVVATPHQLGCFEGRNEAATIRRAVTILNGELQKKSLPLRVWPGGDVRVDERIPALLQADRILTLADGGRFLLLELPHDTILDLRPLLQELATLSVIPIVSHPERNEYLNRHPQAVDCWFDFNAHLQITAGSILGAFGSAAEQSGWYFVTSGMASVVATDAHDLKTRCPRMREAYYAISQRLGEKTAQKLCVENPRRILTGGEITRPDRIE